MKLRYTTRDLLWLSLVVAILLTWHLNNRWDEQRHPLPNSLRHSEQLHEGVKARTPVPSTSGRNTTGPSR